MSIRKRGKNKFQIRIDSNGKSYVKTVSGVTPREAKKLEAEMFVQIESGLMPDNKNIPLNVLFDEHFTKLVLKNRMLIAPRTEQQYVNTYNHDIRNTIGFKKIQSITPYEIEVLLNDIQKSRSLAGDSMKSIHSYLSGIFKFAFQKGFVAENIMRKIPTPTRNKKRKVVLPTNSEIQKLFDLAHELKSDKALLFEFFFLTGLRRGEALGLTWADINEDTREITVAKTVKHLTGHPYPFVEAYAKNDESLRTIPIPDKAFDYLMQIKYAEDQVIKLITPADFVFVDYQGKVLNDDTVSRQFKKLCVELGFHKDFHLHEMRKMFATNCYVSGMPEKEIQRLLGHKSLATTQSYYLHVNDEIKIETKNLLNKIYA